ncbi:MAG: ABC transporter permease [Oscillospiraceae bacterium]|jgi:putative ABC transport system permease protein|nr:ABC transporter permease [Oscillospiraceae bacterium]
MKFAQSFKMAIKSISNNKGRSFLTMLGIIIGVAAVIVLVSLVQGQQDAIMEEFEKMGTNQIQIYYYGRGGAQKDISMDLYNYCMTLDKSLIEGVSPRYNDYKMVKYKAKGSYMDVYMGSDMFSACNNSVLQYGRDISYMDLQRLNKVCVIGAKVKEDLFNYEDPIGKKVTIGGDEYTVIGTYASKGVSAEYGGSWYDRIVVVPYTLGSRLTKSQYSMNNYIVKARSSAATTELIKTLDSWLMSKLGQYNYSIYSDNSWRDYQTEGFADQQKLLAGIASIALIVGGIGIMNIMLVTVTERTREIGIRKAIGAPRRSIITQFLIEAVVLSALGGLVGVMAGTGVTVIMGKIQLDRILAPSPVIMAIAMLVSVAFGVGFGVYPAVRASRLLPVEALRNE